MTSYPQAPSHPSVSTRPVYVLSSAVELPARSRSVDRWARRCGLESRLRERLGAHGADRYFELGSCAELEAAIARALTKVLDAAGSNRPPPSHIVYAHCVPWSRSIDPANNCLRAIPRAYGAGDVPTVSITGRHCVSVYEAMRHVTYALAHNPEPATAVIVTGDFIPPEAERARDCSNVGVFSDAAGAVLLSNECGEFKVEAVETVCDLAYGEQMRAHTSAVRAIKETKLAFDRFGELVELLCEAACAPKESFASVAPHNLDEPMWQKIFAYMKLPPSRHSFMNFSRYGHLLCTDLIANLDIHRLDTRVGQRALSLMRGYGWNFGGLVLERTGA